MRDQDDQGSKEISGGSCGYLYLVSCLEPSYGSAQRFVLLKKTEIEVLCCGCMTIHPKIGYDYPEINS